MKHKRNVIEQIKSQMNEIQANNEKLTECNRNLIAATNYLVRIINNMSLPSDERERIMEGLKEFKYDEYL